MYNTYNVCGHVVRLSEVELDAYLYVFPEFKEKTYKIS